MRIAHFGTIKQINKQKKQSWLRGSGELHVAGLNEFDQMFNKSSASDSRLTDLSRNKTRAGRAAISYNVDNQITPRPLTALGMDFETGKVRRMLNRPPETDRWMNSARLTNRVYNDLPYVKETMNAFRNLKW